MCVVLCKTLAKLCRIVHNGVLTSVKFKGHKYSHRVSERRNRNVVVLDFFKLGIQFCCRQLAMRHIPNLLGI